MCAKRNYSLLSAETNCTWQSININKSNFDLTSVVNALENNEDPSTLFFIGNANTRSDQLENDKANCLLQNIDNVRLWLDQTLYPSLQVMQRKDISQCLKKLNNMRERIMDIAKTSRKRNNKHYTKKQYECICRTCNRGVIISDTNCNSCPILSQEYNQMSGAPVCNAVTHTDAQHKYTETKMSSNENNSNSSSVSDVSVNNNSETEVRNTMVNSHGLPKLCIYNMHVRNIIYPPQLILQICSYENNFDFYSTQKIALHHYRCLICNTDINSEKGLHQHVQGHRHRNALSDNKTIGIVKNYHRVFSCLSTNFQAHQIIFTPFYKIPLLSCLACREQVRENNLMDHLFTAKHIQRLCTKKFMKCHLYDEMLASLGVGISEEDSSDMSSKASFGQNDKLLAALNKPIANKTGYGISNDDTDEDLSEISMKSQVIYNSGYSTQTSLQNSNDSKCAIGENETELHATSTSVDNNEIVAKESVDKRKSEGSPEIDNNNASLVIVPRTAINSSESNNTESTIKQVVVKPAQAEKSNTSPNSNKTTKKLEHNVIVAVNPTPTDMFDFLEHRFHMHRAFLDCVNNNVTCSLCAVQFGNTVLEIKRHLSTSTHMRSARKEVAAIVSHTYFCDLCIKKIYAEHNWFDHVLSFDHTHRKENIARMNQPKGGAFIEYECTSCHYVIFGNKFSVNKHLSEVPNASKKKKKEIKLPQHVEKLLKNNLYFNEEVVRLCRESEKVLKSINLSWKCCEAIQDALEPVFGKCKAYPFGSRVSGLGNTESDLDVFVDTGIMYSGMVYQDPDSQARFVKHTAKALKKHKDFSDIFAIPNARTPIVQVFHRITDLDCDLSFRHGLSVENTNFLRLCIDVQPPLKPFILILKMWSHMCNLNERITTYALSMMSIFFFQMQGYLPSLQRIRQLDTTKPQVIGGWTTFCYNHPISELQQQMLKCDKTTKELICDFFGYFSRFKYETEVICPLLGRTILKVDFHENKGQRLPPEMEAYVVKISECEQNEVFRSLSAMCIQDPFDLSHNLTKACPESVVKKFSTLCAMSNAILGSK